MSETMWTAQNNLKINPCSCLKSVPYLQTLNSKKRKRLEVWRLKSGQKEFCRRLERKKSISLKNWNQNYHSPLLTPSWVVSSETKADCHPAQGHDLAGDLGWVWHPCCRSCLTVFYSCGLS